MRRDTWASVLSWWSCQSLVVHSCGLMNHPNSFHGGMFKLNAKFDADSLLYSVFLNVRATQYTCSLKGICHPHWLVQRSRHCSHMLIPVHSPWLPGYIYITQTILVILIMVGLLPDRPHIITERLCFIQIQSSATMNIELLMKRVTITLRKQDLSNTIKSIYLFFIPTPLPHSCYPVSLNLAQNRNCTNPTYIIQIVY